MSKDEVAYLLGAYIRCGRKTGNNRIAFPTPLPPTNQVTFTIPNESFSKEFTVGPSIGWVETENLIPRFLEGFFIAKEGNTWKGELHLDYIIKWMESCNIQVTQQNNSIVWDTIPSPLISSLRIKEDKRRIFVPTPPSLPLLHGIYWCKHKIISPGVAELGPLPEDVFKYVLKKLDVSYRSNKKMLRIRTASLDPPGLPKPQCLSTQEDYKDFLVGWYEGEPPEQIAKMVKFNKWEYLELSKSR